MHAGSKAKSETPAVETAFIVTLRFEFPAWDETAGIPFEVDATCKSQAISRARRDAERDGHVPCRGKGRATFKAEAA